LKKILVADDHPEILEVVTEVLSYETFEVRGLSSGINLIADVKEFKPDLVLLDLKLGEDDGSILCRQIKALPDFQNTPVIIYSAYVPNRPQPEEYGCDEMITKPFDIDELVTKINRLVCQD
jgi:DNA-binding response OmpR family regulator